MLAFAAAFFVSWTVFAVLYYIVAFYRGDLLADNLGPHMATDPEGNGYNNGSWRPCVWEIYNFTSAFLFSVETQHTIG